MKPGRPLERLVAAIERVLTGREGVTIESPRFLPDRVTGEPREHDVVVTFATTHHQLVLAIECRARSRKVTVNDVEGFWSKCQDTGVNKGIIVSPRGFSKPAMAKARVKGIGCLTLSEVDSFNWLLAPGVHVRNRRILATHWTLIPENNLVPKPTSFSVLALNGQPVPPEIMTAVAREELRKLSDEQLPVGHGRTRILFTAPGLSLRDDTTATVHPIVKALAEIEYEITEDLVPFNLVKYTDGDTGTLITDAAVAEVDFGKVAGRLMIVYKEDEGGHVVFVPDKKADA